MLTIISFAFLIIGCSPGDKANSSTSNEATSKIEEYKGTGQLTQGPATTITKSLINCSKGGSRVSGVGEIKDQAGKNWIVSATHNF